MSAPVGAGIAEVYRMRGHLSKGPPEADLRVLVTASRAWPDPDLVWEALGATLIAAGRRRLVVVHGACPSGGDLFAHNWALRMHGLGSALCVPEPHPADWEAPCRGTCIPGHRRSRRNGVTYCPAAGFSRNELMIGLGAHICLAFILDGSNGATHCADLAERAGIPTSRWRA